MDKFTLSYGEFMAKLGKAVYFETFTRGGYEFDLQSLINVNARQHPVWSGKTSDLIEELQSLLSGGNAIILLGGTPRSCDGLYEDLKKAGLPAVRDNAPKPPLFKGVTIAEGGLSGGFEYFSVGTVLLSWGRYVNPTSAA